jgi:hypothetical protein
MLIFNLNGWVECIKKPCGQTSGLLRWKHWSDWDATGQDVLGQSIGTVYRWGAAYGSRKRRV